MLANGFREKLADMYENRLISPFLQVTKEDLLKNGLIVYGGDIIGKLTIERLLANGIKPDWIVDANIDIIGKKVMGIDVLNPDSLKKAGDRFVFLCSTNIKAMSKTCKEKGASKWITAAALRKWFDMSCQFGICMEGSRHDDELEEVYTLLQDEKSKKILEACVRWHHTFDNDFSSLMEPYVYFPEDLKEKIDYSHFVDAGAFTGDTLNEWMNIYKPEGKLFKYYAFEPMDESWNQLQDYVKRLPKAVQECILTIKAGLSNRNTFIEMSGSRISQTESDTGIECKTIDSFFQSHPAPTIIKADIEGAEMDMLMGAEQIIKKYKPALAIAVYHKYSDLWAIPLWIHKLNLDYKLYFRHNHPRFTDTVCFAISS